MQVNDVLDSEGELVERTDLNDVYDIQCNFLEYEHLAFSIRNKLSEFSQNRKQAIGSTCHFYCKWFNVKIKAVKGKASK